MTEFIQNPSWPDSVKTTENGKYEDARTITIVFVENIMRRGGYYAVWQGEENIYEGNFYKAKQVATDAQGENGRPIEEKVVPV